MIQCAYKDTISAGTIEVETVLVGRMSMSRVIESKIQRYEMMERQGET